MPKDVDFFTKIFDKQISKNRRYAHSNMIYGANVMPILEIYPTLSDVDERESFIQTLKTFLTDSNQERIDFAVNVCLGFFVFRDAIQHK